MTTLQSPRDVEPELIADGPDAREKQGRRWLIWSFIFCPCHLPLTMALLAAIFGGSALGALISRNALTVGVLFGLIYASGVAIGFHHLRQAAAGKDCSAGSCDFGFDGGAARPSMDSASSTGHSSP